MRFFLPVAGAAILYGALLGAARAQSSSMDSSGPAPSDVRVIDAGSLGESSQPVAAAEPERTGSRPETGLAWHAQAAAPAPVAEPAKDPEPAHVASPQEEITLLQKKIETLEKERVAALRANPEDDQTKKRLDLQQKEIETLEKMVRLLADQLKKQPGGQDVEKLQTQTATLEARSKQAALRDRDLAQAIDNVTEHVDAEEQNGPRLPATLKQLFDPFDNNETPLSIYGALAFGYQKIIGDAANAPAGPRPPTFREFYFGEFTPDFLLKLNDWIFLEAEIGIGANGAVSAGSFAQADFFVNDWLTIIAGRFVAPIGWWNERINNPWINKLPADAPGSSPLPWLQVLPPFSLLGVQATGSFYLGCSPLKMEYAAYISNGLNLTPAAAGAPTVSELANLENMTNTFTVITNEKAVGGRVGLWWPEVGLEGGLSGMYNGDYVAGGFEDSISLWALDLNYHKCNWDVRAEYGFTYQQARSFLPQNVRRNGFYGQVAYRPRDASNRYLQKTEFIYRYSYVDFQGIDKSALDLTTFATPIDVPVRRQQNEFGIDYWFYPRMALKVAYQINDEPGFHLRDNMFVSELAWGW